MRAAISLLLTVALIGMTSWTVTGQDPVVFNNQADELYHKSLDLFNAGKYAAAREGFEEFLDLDDAPPSYRSAHMLIAAEYYIARSGLELQNEGADALMLEFINKHTDNPYERLANYHLGKYYYLNRKFRNTIRFYEMVDMRELNPDERAEYMYQLGYAYFTQKKFDKAYEYISKTANIDNKYYHPSNYYLGILHYQKGNYDDALACFNLVKDARIYARAVPYYIGHIHFSQGKYDQVIAYFEPLIDDEKILYKKEIHHLLGITYFRKGMYEKAANHLQYYMDYARKVNKEDIYQLAFSQYKIGRLEDAIKNFEQLNIAKDEMGQFSMYMLADCYLKKDRKEDARRAFSEAMLLDFDEEIKEWSLFNYGKLSYELGYSGEAIQALQSFITKYPKSKDFTEANELLTDLFLSSKDYAKALEMIRKMPVKTPKIAEAYQKITYFLGVQEFQHERYKKAEEYFDLSLKRGTDTRYKALCYYWKADLKYRQKEFDESIQLYQQYLQIAPSVLDLPDEASVLMANYNLGYGYYAKKNYKTALIYFDRAGNRYTKDKNQIKHALVKKHVAPDIALRKGDCHFILKDYDQAKENYEVVINANHKGIDYAYYQIGIIEGIQGSRTAKLTTLKRVINAYPNSDFVDEALMEIGDTYLRAGDYRNAITYFDKAKTSYPEIPEVQRRSLLNLGLAYYRLKDLNTAVEQYSKVLDQYPKTPEAREAYEALKELAIEISNPDIVIPYAGEKISEIDSITYLAAEKVYFDKNCDKAIAKFDEYINKFPKGYFLKNAHYYKSECLYAAERYDEALPGYTYVTKLPSNQFSERSMLKAARINYYEKEDYQTALQQYKGVVRVTDNAEYRKESILGGMRCAFKVEDHLATEELAGKALELDLTDIEKQEAHYYLGKAAFARGNEDMALQEFQSVFKLGKNEYAAEAKYLEAEIQLKRGQFEKAEAAALEVRDEVPSYHFWLAKSYIILADIFTGKKDYFQAKATLNSILEGYENAEISQICIAKLEEIEKLEKLDSKINEENEELEFVNPDDQ